MGTKHPYPVKWTASEWVLSGYSKFIAKSDQEPAILDVKRGAIAEVRKTHSVEVIPEESPVGASASNSAIERFIWEVESMVRTLKYHAEQLHKIGCKSYVVDMGSQIWTTMLKPRAEV